jgi:hypothetical protein
VASTKSDIEALLDDLERQDWRVVRRGKYYVCYCPCPMKHLKTVHVTPSDSRYLLNLKGQLKRATCWKEGKR